MILTGTVSRNSDRPKHRAGTPRLPDMLPLATCDDHHGQAMGWGCIEPWCRRHDPEQYAVHWAAHRADRPRPTEA